MQKSFLLIIIFVLPHYLFGQNESDDNKVYTITEVQAEYPGGVKEFYDFVFKNFKYPQELIRTNFSCGKVLVSFIIEKDGSLTNVKVEKGCHKLYDAELIKVIATMPKWKPAIHQKKAVSSRFTLPIFICLE